MSCPGRLFRAALVFVCVGIAQARLGGGSDARRAAATNASADERGAMTNGTMLERAPVGSSCVTSAMQRRRRGSDMCSCRRRSGASNVKAGWSCQNNAIKPCGDSCPLGYSPPVDHVKGHNLWCEIAVPKEEWQIANPALGASSSAIPLKVLSYNLFWWNLFGIRNGNERSAGALVAAGANETPFDVMGFQECDDIDRILGDATAEGLRGEYSGVNGGRGMAVAYRSATWELVDSGNEDVGEDGPQEYYGIRSAQWVRLRKKDTGRVVLFANHHGPLPVSNGGGCTGSSTAYNILGMIASNMHVGDTVVLVGDFNAQPHSSRVQAMDRHLYRIFSGSAHGGVDHIFSNTNSSILATANLGSGGSDHDAITATIAI